MSRKLLLIAITAGTILVGAYFFIRYSLKKQVATNEEEMGKLFPLVDSLGGEKVSAADIRPLLIQRLQYLLKKSSNGLYDLRIADMKADVVNSTLSLSDVSIRPGTLNPDSIQGSPNLPENIFDISFPHIVIEGINIDDAVNTKVMDYSLVRFVNPVIRIHYRKSESKESKTEENFSSRFLKEMQRLSIDKLIVEGGTLITYNDAKKTSTNKLDAVDINLTRILIDSTTREDTSRFLFAEDAHLSFKNYSLPTADGLYVLTIGKGSLNASKKNISLENLSFRTPLSKGQFVAKQKYSRELYHLTLPSVTIRNVDWWSLLNREEIVADSITTKGGNLSIFLDRSLRPRSKVGNFPNQLLMKIPLKMNIDRVNINDLDFSYEEYNPVSEQNGKIFIDKVSLEIANVSNTRKGNIRPVVAKGSGLFMHSVPMHAQFSFDMSNYKSGKFTADITAEGFDGTLINSFAAPMGLMRVEKANIRNVKAQIHGNEWKSYGKILLEYNDLKLSLLEKDHGENLDKKDFTSSIANMFVLKKDNLESGKKPTFENAEFKRTPEGGFFMLVWKTMMVGTLKTINAPEKIAYKTIASQQQEQKD